MNAQSERDIVDVMNAQKPNSRSFSQKLSFRDSNIEHENLLEVSRIQGRSEPFEIKNHFASISDGQVMKVTEIYIGDKVIRIVDCFKPSIEVIQEKTHNLPTKNQESISEAPKRKNILNKQFKNGLILEKSEEFKVRDTKNLVKNIFKLFKGWVEDSAPQELRNGLKVALQDLLAKNGKFNNSLIISLSKQQLLRKAFMTFSQTKGQELIDDSKIHDKQCHVQALQKYRRICCDQQQQLQMRNKVELKKQRREFLSNCQSQQCE